MDVPFGPPPATEEGDVHHSACQFPQRSRLSITSLAPPTEAPLTMRTYCLGMQVSRTVKIWPMLLELQA